jgi:hypothetical protein
VLQSDATAGEEDAHMDDDDYDLEDEDLLDV